MFEIRRRSLRELARHKPTHLFSTIIAAMGYAKSLGRDPGEFVRFFMERQTDWEKLRGDLEGVFRAFVVNFQEHTDMLDDEFDVVVGPEGVSLGAAPIEELFKDELEKWGLTPEEVRRGWDESAPYISRFTGLRVSYDHANGKYWIHIAGPVEEPEC
ncbi:MAG: hypothetical protein LOD85_02120 [Clostridia bacterium]|nr:hypothetical protein [Bacillota bacterium]MBO2520947.1 hypothetical protein [Bacillota bacterium]